MKSDFSGRVEKQVTVTDDITHRLDDLEIRQEEFVRMTQSKLAQLSKIENQSHEMLTTIEKREIKNREGMEKIETFEATTANKIYGMIANTFGHRMYLFCTF